MQRQKQRGSKTFAPYTCPGRCKIQSPLWIPSDISPQPWGAPPCPGSRSPFSDETARCFTDTKWNDWNSFIDGSNSLSENGIYPQNCSFDQEIKMINPCTLTLGLSLCPLGLPSTFARKLATGLARSETISAISVAGIELVRPACFGVSFIFKFCIHFSSSSIPRLALVSDH